MEPRIGSGHPWPGENEVAQNNFQGKSDAALSATAHQAYTIINANLLGYGVSAPQILAVENGADTLDTDVTDVTAKTAALKAAHEHGRQHHLQQPVGDAGDDRRRRVRRP
jgi:hypothetical protein